MPRHTTVDDDPSGRRRRRLFLAAVVATTVAAGTALAVTGAGQRTSPGGEAGPDTTAVLGARAGESVQPLQAPPSQAPPSQAPPSQAPPSPAPLPATFSLLAAGDLLTHGPVVRSATSDGGTIDFSPLLAGLDPWVQGADLALCHLEVPVAPKGVVTSGYPLFAAPPALVRDLAEQGWDGCSTASNHAVDRGFDGVRATIRRLDAAGMGHAGTAVSAAQQERPQLYRIRREGREMTVAHLSATFSLNGLPMPADAPWAVDLIDADRIVAQARAARAAGADVVLVSLHAGTEYTETLTDQQTEVVARLAKSRQVDLVIGHHAHVPQAIDRVGRGPGGRGMWVAYGLGNLLSNQDSACCDARTSNGVLLSATFTRRPGSPTRIASVGWTASTVDIAAGHEVHALRDLLEAPEGTTLSGRELADRADRVAAAVGDVAKQRTRPPEPSGPAPEVVPRRSG